MRRTIRLNESELKRMITKSVRSILNEMERSHPGDIPPGDEDIYYPGDINPDVWDALSRGDYGEDEDSDEVMENKRRQRISKIVSEAIKRVVNEAEDDSDMKRNAVMKSLKDPKFNHAQLAYSLWPDMDKDTARSLFAKMANGTPDNDGVVRHFSDEDVNSLYQMIRKR